MHIQCPHCHNPIELVETPPPREVVCTVCGSSINLDPGQTLTMIPETTRRRLGRFELIEIVGVGAHGTVYKARDTQLDRIVAVKVPRVTALPSQEDVDRFLRESRSTAQLKHPSIVSLYDAGQVDGTCYLVSEFVQGATLADRLTSCRLTFRQAAELIAEIADALHYAHDQGIVHRDVKPSNIMLDLKGQPHVMDFGLAKREAGEITMTIDGQILGTPAYMSPEQARGEGHRVDSRSDIYSLGVVLYELLTGELPFRGNTRMLLVQVLQDEPRPLRRLNDRISKDLETVCLKAMAKEPGRRYQRAVEFAEDLRRWLRDEPVLARPVSSTVKLAHWCRRNPAIAGLSAAVALLLLSVAVGASLSALHLRKLADRERQLHSESDTARQAAVGATARAVEARQEAVTARDQEAVERNRAEALAKNNRVALYAARVNLAQQAFESADVSLAIELLHSQLPKPGEEDLRGFEWYYLWQLCHSDRLTVRVDNNTPVRGVALSSNGKWFAAVAGQIVRLCDVATGQVYTSFRMPMEARAVAFSPDGQLLAVGGGNVGQTGRVMIWDLTTKLERATWSEFADPVLAIAFAPDGKTLATGTTPLEHGWGNPLTRIIWAGAARKKNQVKLWSIETAKTLVTCDGETGGILSLAFSRDGKTLAAGGWDASVRLWDAATGQAQSSRKRFTSYVWSVAFTPNGDLIAGGGKWDGQPELKTWLAGVTETAVPSSHTAGITSLAFSRDGKLLATASWDRVIKVRDVATGDELHTFKGHTSYVSAVAFSPDGDYLVSSSWDGTVKVWYTRTPLDQTTLAGWDLGGYCVSFDSKGQLLATATGDSVSIWDLSSGEIRVSLPGHSQTLVAFAPDGQTLATTGMDRIVRIYDTSSWKQLRTLEGHSGAIWALAYSPHAEFLATGSQDKTAKLWDVATGRELATMKGGLGGTVRSVAFSPNSEVLAMAVHVRGEGKSMVKVWDVVTRRETVALDAHRHNIECVAFSPDGKTLATSSHDTTAMLWDTQTWKPRATLKGHIESIYHLAFSPDGKTLATAGWDGIIALWNTASGQRLATLKGHSGTVWNVAFSPNGKTLCSGSTYQVAATTGSAIAQEVKLWHGSTEHDVDVQTRLLATSEGSWPTILRGHDKAVQSVAYARAGDILASVDSAGTLIVWDLAGGRERSRTKAHQDEITCLKVSPDGSLVATASLDGTTKLWELPANRVRATLRAHHGRIDAVAFSPDGKIVATGGVEDRATILWDVSTGNKLVELVGEDTVSCLAFSPDGKLLVIGSWGPTRVQLWDVAARKKLRTLTGHSWGVTCVAVSLDGSKIAAGGGWGDPTIRVWDVASGEERATLIGHMDETTALAFSPDGKWLLSGSWDRMVKLWDLTPLQEHRTVFGHTDSILDLAVSESDGSIATASADGSVRIWNWPSAHEHSIALPKPAAPRIPPPQRQFADLQKLYHQREWEALAQAATDAAQVLSSKKSVYQYLGEAHFQLKHYAPAVAAFDRHLELCPKCLYVMGRLAICHSALGAHAEAVKLQERMLEIDPNRLSAGNDLAWLYITGPEEVRNVQRGLELARKAVESEPANWSYWNTLGVAHYRAGEFPKAIDALLHASESNPAGATAFDLFFLAMSRHQLGETEKARESYDEASKWWQEQSNLSAEWKSELEAFRTEAAGVLGIAAEQKD